LALTLPIPDLIDRLRVTSVTFRPDWGQEQSGLGSGAVLTKDLRPPLWWGSFEGRQLTHAQAAEVEALVEAMEGSIETFFAWNPARWYPIADHQGATLGAATVRIHTVGGDNRSLRLRGLPAGYVLTRGDLLSFDYGAGSSRACHRVVEASAIADGAGVTPLFDVRPHIRVGAEVDAVVSLIRPGPEMRIIPGTYEPAFVDRRFASIRFEAIQVL